MKRQYLIPSMTVVAIQFSSICTASSTGLTIGGNTTLGSGGESGGTIDPM